MIYITGDIHGSPYRFSTREFPEGKEMTKDDVVIICGDFGLIWDLDKNNVEEKYWLKWLEEKPFTTVFVDGNHENFDRLNTYPVKEWNGGMVHEIRPHVLHLMRGEVFTIQGKKFFAFGGASSHDISDGIIDGTKANWKEKCKELDRSGKYMYRIKGISWWEQELPTQEEMDHGKEKLKENNMEVDYIISHCAPQEVASVFSMGLYKSDVLTNYFNEILHSTKFTHWYFEHYHDDKTIMGKFTMLYDNIERVV